MTALANSEPETSIEKRAIALAERLLAAANAEQTAREKRDAAQMSRMMEDTEGKQFTFAMADQIFRSNNAGVRARRWRELISDYGAPGYLSLVDHTLMRIGAAASAVAPGVVMGAVEHRMRADFARVILPEEIERLHRYLGEREAAGFRINLNHLGEAVLSEAEAERRKEAVLAHLRDPAVRYVSVKISAIFSQINLGAWKQTLATIKARLREVYRVAAEHGKFVNLDMEEFRDLELTITAFRELLDEPEFLRLPAGIVLQAYLPDSWAAQQRLTEWAKARVAKGGERIKVRVVKGANLAMEAVESELHGWNPAPYATKPETDANFRRMVEFGCRAENAAAVQIGVASHNLFDVALALTLREESGTTDLVEIEMLEGMANHQSRAVMQEAGGLLIYAPAVQRHDFLSAMAYLFRRLDENTAPGNFLRDMFGMRPGSPEWESQRAAFEAGWRRRAIAPAKSRRSTPAPAKGAGFFNEPDTDWTQPDARAAMDAAIEQHKDDALPPVPELDALMRTAVRAHAEWSARPQEERAGILREAASVMSAQRFQTIACLRDEGKKAVAEADGEVSEAVDFARYYAESATLPAGVVGTPAGVTLVTPPWNFPYAIPCGGVLAALVAGNAVVLKPAPETRQIAWLLARQLWQAGVPRGVLQFFPCDDGDTGRALVCHPDVACVVLTGGWQTARLFQQWNPSMRLLAETSGKNAIVITAQADRELAIKDLVRSAFGHSGQKCSAASLAIVEAEVYDDPGFQRQLREATESLHVGPSSDARSVITPLIREPSEMLRRALTQLESGEEWLLKPAASSDDPCSWSPGIRLGVKPGSWFHLTECFGPVLGLMRAESLAQAVEWQNAVSFGLTAGIHSLDSAELEFWQQRVHAGNLYINRPISGAIVQRQPFGGWKRSCLGPGAKAGGPNYVWSFLNIAEAPDATGFEESYRAAWQTHFSIEHDPSALRAESNVFRYRPARGVILRLPSTNEKIIRRARLAAELTGTPLTVSIASEIPDAEFALSLATMENHAEFLRIVEPCEDSIFVAAQTSGLNVISAPLTANGRVELRHWLREQSVSRTLHRYGQMPAAPAQT